MKKFWIIGHPLDFCLSTPVFTELFKELGIDASIETHDIEPEGLDLVMEKLSSGELDGLITTMPHKTPTIEFLDEVIDEAKIINAVNLVQSIDGMLFGYNTDWMGAVQTIMTRIPDVKGLKVHILGAGGAARAAAFGLNAEGAKVSIWNRTPERAREFAEKIGIEWVKDMRIWDGKPDVIINATSASYQPSQSTLVPYPLWENVKVAVDAVYGKTSLFLEEAKAAQVPEIIAGEEWFMYQAEAIFTILTGKEVPHGSMKKYTEKFVPKVS